MLPNVVLLISLIWAQAPVTNQSDPWAGLRFLAGTWEAKTTGGSAGVAASGTYTFRFELGNHVLARHSRPAGCEGPETFNCEHADLLYIYSEAPGQAPKAIYWDNEGHVIHYDVSTPEEPKAVFLSDPARPGPQFRLSYERKGPMMLGSFGMRMPGQGEFQPYLTWSGTKLP